MNKLDSLDSAVLLREVDEIGDIPKIVNSVVLLMIGLMMLTNDNHMSTLLNTLLMAYIVINAAMFFKNYRLNRFLIDNNYVDSDTSSQTFNMFYAVDSLKRK